MEPFHPQAIINRRNNLQDSYDISAIILDKENRGESSVMLTAFSSEKGLMYLFKRMSGKKTSLIPDLFDEITCKIRQPDFTGNIPVTFLQSFEIIKHRQGISTSYNKLCSASDISLIVKHNGENINETHSLYSLLSKTFEGIEKTKNMPAVQIKFLYLLTKEQGYAIKEDFFQSLSNDDKTTFAHILKTPSQNLDEHIYQAEKLNEMLKRWIQENTDIIIQ